MSLMEIQLSASCPFNLDFTLCCGQTFRWDKHREWWYGAVGEKVFRIRQNDDKLEFENVSAGFVKDYFGLYDDLPKIFSQITKDKHIEAATDQFKGLRILRQDPWECLISYICATYKSISAIKRMLFDLAKKFGEKVCLDHDSYDSYYAFPTPSRLARASVNELVSCGLGYRAKYVSGTAKMMDENGFNLERLKRASYEKARRELLDFPGAGFKVADCVLLFSLEKLEAFPVDIWIKRAILRYYSKHFPTEFVKRISGERSLSGSEYVELNSFGRRYFGQYAGYAQEYLYHYERTQR